MTEREEHRLLAAVDKVAQWKKMYKKYIENINSAKSFASAQEALEDAAYALDRLQEARDAAAGLYLDLQLHTPYVRLKRLLNVSGGPWF